MAYLYRHIRLDKNEPFYIGIGSDSYGKYKRAKEKCGRSGLWNKIAKKTDYKIDIILDDIDFEYAKLKEIEFISLYGRINTNTGILANMTDGGDGVLGLILSEGTRDIISTKLKEKYKNGELLPNKTAFKKGQESWNKGKETSVETREKLSLIRKSKYKNGSLSVGDTAFKKGYIPWNKGAKMNDEFCKKNSEAQKENYKNGFINPKSKMVINIESGFIYNSSKEAWIASGLNCHKDHFRSMLNGRRKNSTNFEYLK
jgi:hypothetical protein